MGRFAILCCLLLSLLIGDGIAQLTGNTQSTGYICAGSYALLECPIDYMIIVSSITHKYTPSQCADFVTENEFGGKGTSSLDTCVGIDNNDERLSGSCNGQETCHYLLEKKIQKLGYDGTTCDFVSNIANINYVCIPNRMQMPYKSFDICDPDGPDTIIGLDSGFLHSPNYPNYYGNNRFCYMNVGIPEGKRLVVYLIAKSMESLSFFDKKPTDYLIIDNEFEIFGTSNRPSILFNSTSSKDKVQIKFKSDWITSVQLRSPKGFLIFFEIIPAIVTVPQIPTTTPQTTTLQTTVEQNNTNDSLKEELIFRQHLISQKLKHDFESRKQESDQIVTVVSTLVALIGLLTLTIFGLLLLFRKKQNQQNDDIYHDVNDQKSISDSSNIYSEDYQNNPNITNDGSSLSFQQNKTTNSKSPSKFNTRLINFYKQLNQNLNVSNKVLRKSTKSANDIISSHANTPSKTFNINEFNPNDVDIKFEKDTPIDKLKLFKMSTTSTKSAANLFKKNNVENEKEFTNRCLENTYVSNPTVMYEHNASNKLQIYEVNFDNNFAYITPSLESKSSSSILMSPPPVPGSFSTSNNQIDDTEIYQSINDLDGEQIKAEDESVLIENDQLRLNNETLNETVDSTKEMIGQSIYNVPTNKRVTSSENSDAKQIEESFIDENNTSNALLLNQTQNETQA